MRRWQTTRGGASEIGPWSCPMLARRGLRGGGWGNAWPTEVAEGVVAWTYDHYRTALRAKSTRLALDQGQAPRRIAESTGSGMSMACPGGSTVTSRAPLRRTRGGDFA